MLTFVDVLMLCWLQFDAGSSYLNASQEDCGSCKEMKKLICIEVPLKNFPLKSYFPRMAFWREEEEKSSLCCCCEITALGKKVSLLFLPPSFIVIFSAFFPRSFLSSSFEVGCCTNSSSSAARGKFLGRLAAARKKDSYLGSESAFPLLSSYFNCFFCV